MLQMLKLSVTLFKGEAMLTYDQYDADHPLICNEYETKGRKERRRRRAFQKASKLQSRDLSRYATRAEAQEALESDGEELVVGSGGIVFMILSSVISWMIRKLLDDYFGVDESTEEE